MYTQAGVHTVYIIYTQYVYIYIYILNVEKRTTKNKEKMPLLTGLHGFLQLQAPWSEIFFNKKSSSWGMFFFQRVDFRCL